ncbi:hypothetical protein HELRODRAFT_165190 [Helobdella robusta]|uniref:Uncharacterized protein n=1 Tax=Helobdella robusta TaxID=6412 RepID=T1EWE7_HELRO|nr:hypothetical protein HELRODRAFT_165190 [Helobdella robusta]ESN93034.1 hypothetical protein HELRODRAFT_165190 [Helobdella robusta]
MFQRQSFDSRSIAGDWMNMLDEDLAGNPRYHHPDGPKSGIRPNYPPPEKRGLSRIKIKMERQTPSNEKHANSEDYYADLLTGVQTGRQADRQTVMRDKQECVTLNLNAVTFNKLLFLD